ncbi:guanine nucleotide binding protein, alpha subunit, partial [Gorgonomyces haynaldii]
VEISYMDKIDEIFRCGYTPNDQDILCFRQKTENIVENTFEIGGVMWNIVDVAGQKELRHRWIPYFDTDVKAILYLVNSVGFCQAMEEEPDSNRLADSIELFETLLKNPSLKKPHFIIFLNKVDLLPLMLQKHKVSDFVPAYMGVCVDPRRKRA